MRSRKINLLTWSARLKFALQNYDLFDCKPNLSAFKILVPQIMQFGQPGLLIEEDSTKR